MHDDRTDPEVADEERPAELSTQGTKMLVSNLGPDVTDEVLFVSVCVCVCVFVHIMCVQVIIHNLAQVKYSWKSSSLPEGVAHFQKRCHSFVLRNLLCLPTRDRLGRNVVLCLGSQLRWHRTCKSSSRTTEAPSRVLKSFTTRLKPIENECLDSCTYHINTYRRRHACKNA